MRIYALPEELVGGELTVRGDEHHYLCRVRRARIGDSVEVVDGEGRRATAIIERFAEDETTLSIGLPEAINELPPLVRVLLPLIKGDRMDAALEKLVEVGASEIVVWPAERSMVKLEAKRDQRLVKYQATLRAAARQSGRPRVPMVTYAESLAAAIAGSTGVRITLDPECLTKLAVGSAAEVTIASGPEGGLAPGELEQLSVAGFAPAGLGPRTLRAETAPTIAVALIRAATNS
ncbi:MAG: RsmE family RNA methyltransferase [Kofleriaceae bacterium]